jgi:F-type H+-transporting ATPase subunit b
MALLTPESGLLFWMFLSFGIVVIVLSRFGFPIILKMVESRKSFIDESLLVAKQAHAELAKVKADGLEIIDNARREQVSILNDATATRDLLIKDAKAKASLEALKIIEGARRQILIEKDDAIRDIRRQVTELSIDIAEKLIREKLSHTGEHMNLINRMLGDINISKS